MKNRIPFAGALFAFFLMAFVLWGCKEVGPYVNLGGTVSSVTYIENPPQAPHARNLLVELLTGVSCPNCPAAHVQLDNAISQYSSTANHLIGVEFHPGPAIFSQDDMPPQSSQNLTSSTAITILSSSNNILQYSGFGPAFSVDRVTHPAAGINATPSAWDFANNMNGYVSTEVTVAAPVNVYIYNTWNAALKQANVWVSLHYTAAQSDSDKLSIFLTEDSIITSQVFPGYLDTNYVENHVLRTSLTSPLGDNIGVPTFVAGRVDSVNYSYTFTSADSLWKPQHMHVVAFVHKYQNGLNNVLQCQTAPLMP